MDFEFERRLARITGAKEPHYGEWKSRTTAAAQKEQRTRNGEFDRDGNRT